MDSFLLYILESSICISLFYLLFKTLMRKETSFSVNRALLLTIISSSLIIPVIQLPQQIKAPRSLQFEQQFTRKEIQPEKLQVSINNKAPISQETDKREKASIWTLSEVLKYLYIFGTVIAFSILIKSIVLILILFQRAKTIQMDGYRLLIIDHEVPSFVFRHSIIISQSDYDLHRSAILTHELAHIRFKHFYDLILLELVKIFHWFNPTIYSLINDMKDIHEFQADSYTLNNGIDTKDYQLLIIQKGVGPRRFALANSFNHCQIKKRLIMMNKQKTSKAWRWKVATFLPMLAILLMSFGRNERRFPPDPELISGTFTSISQGDEKQWNESDFGRVSAKVIEKHFFNGEEMMNVLINMKSQITMDGVRCQISDVSEKVMKYRDYSLSEKKSAFKKLTINGTEKMYGTTPIFIRKDIGTDSKTYQELLNAIGNSVLKVREKYALEVFKNSYQNLNQQQKNDINSLVPLDVFIVEPQKAIVAQKSGVTAPPPPPPKVMNLGFQITIDKDQLWIKGKAQSWEEMLEMLKNIDFQKEFIKIDTHSTSNKELLEKIKNLLEKQKITYQINWSNL